MSADLVLDAVEKAIWVHEREDRANFTALAAHHHGSQHLTVASSQHLAHAGIRPSVGAVGSSDDCECFSCLAETWSGIRPKRSDPSSRIDRLVSLPPRSS